MYNLTPSQTALLAKAYTIYGTNITPCGGLEWEQCFDTFNGLLRLWLNLENHSTAIVMEEK